MDNNEQQGFFGHLLDAHPQIRQQLQSVFGGLIPDTLPSDSTAAGATTQQSPSSDLPPPPPYETVIAQGDLAQADRASSSLSSEIIHPSQGTLPMPYDNSASRSLSETPLDTHDVEMTSSPERSTPLPPAAPVDPPRPSVSTRNSRRARVDNEEDEEDTRDTNRQRMHPHVLHDEDHHFHPDMLEHARQHREQQEARAQQQSPDTPRDTPHINHIFYRIDLFPPMPTTAGSTAEQPERQPDAGQQPRPTFGPVDGGFVFNFPLSPDGLGFPPRDPAQRAAGDGGAEGQDNDFMHFFNALRDRMGPIAWGLHEEEPDDPERAKRLLSGLEEVPEGLIKRMERVASEQTLCAICFEHLLVDQDEQGMHEDDNQLSQDSPSSPPVDVDSASNSSPSSSEPKVEVKPLPKVIVLPCSHVFHTSCLKPWFTRPHRTTCPTCRFDIDPDSLTWVPLPRQRVRRPRQGAAPAQDTQTRTTDVNAEPSGDGNIVPPSVTSATGVETQPGATPPFDIPFYVVDLNMIIPMPPRQAPDEPARAAADTPPIASPSSGPAFRRPENSGSTQPTGPRTAMPVAEQIYTRFRRHGPIVTGLSQTQPRPATHRPQMNSTLLTNLLNRNPGFAPVLSPLMRTPSVPQPAERGPLPGFNELIARIGEPPLEEPTTNPVPHGPTPGPTTPGRPFQAQINDIAHSVATSILRSMFPGLRPTGEQGVAPPSPPPPPPGPIPFVVPPPGERQHTPRPTPPEKRQWTPPPPPGITLRERIEKKEREMCLRCSDISCGLGPSDEDPIPTVDVSTIRQVRLKPRVGTDGGEYVCEHMFHPSCLVSAERVAGWGGEDQKQEVEGEGDVEVSCPVCRAAGCVTRIDWDEGACALA